MRSHQLGGWGGSSGCWLLHPHQGGFWHCCNIFTDKQMKYGLCKCSEVDWNLADGPGREGCGEQHKVQLEASAVPQVPQHYLDLHKWPEKWDIVHSSGDWRWYKTSGGCGELRWTRWLYCHSVGCQQAGEIDREQCQEFQQEKTPSPATGEEYVHTNDRSFTEEKYLMPNSLRSVYRSMVYAISMLDRLLYSQLLCLNSNTGK